MDTSNRKLIQGERGMISDSPMSQLQADSRQTVVNEMYVIMCFKNLFILIWLY